MAGLTLLRLHDPPQVQKRADVVSEFLTPATRAVYQSGVVGNKVPGIVTACVSRLSAALASGGPPPEVAQWVPYMTARLVLDGEVLFVVRVENGSPVLYPAKAVSVEGRIDQLRYDVEIPGPSRILTIDGLGRESVAHLILHPDPVRPWRGRPWREVAGSEGLTLTRLLARFSEETYGPTGKVLTRVSQASGPGDWYEGVSKNLNQMHGGVSLLPDYGSGASGSHILRIGVDVPSSVITLYEKLASSVAQSLGFPPQLVGLTATGATARRDMLATWLRGVVSGWTQSFANEITRVLETPVSWNLSDALKTDSLPGRIRGAVALANSEHWTKEEAEELAGLR